MARAEAAARLNACVTWLDPQNPTDGEFAGIPTVLKDNEEMTGYPTTFGSRAVPRHPRGARLPLRGPLAAAGVRDPGQERVAGVRADGHDRVRWITAPPATRGGSTTAPVVPPAARRRWSRPGWCRSPTPTTAVGRSGSRPRAAAWWGSNRRAGVWSTSRRWIRLPVNIVTQGVVTRSVRDTVAFYRGDGQDPSCGRPPTHRAGGRSRELAHRGHHRGSRGHARRWRGARGRDRRRAAV